MSRPPPAAWRTLAAAVVAAGGLAWLGGCAGSRPAPEWQAGARTAMERTLAAHLGGQAQVEAQEFDRARGLIAATGRLDLLARAELMRCAAQVASLSFGACAGFERLRADAAPAERAYADYLAARIIAPADVGLLPEQHRAVAGSGAGAGAATAARTIADPLARLIASGVVFQAGGADPALIASAVDTASAQGWRRPLLAWLGVQRQRAEQAGAADDAARLQRRIELARGELDAALRAAAAPDRAASQP